MDQINFSQKLDFRRYFWFNIKYLFSRPSTIVFQAVIGIIVLVLVIGMLLEYASLAEVWNIIKPIVLLGGFLIGLPTALYFL